MKIKNMVLKAEISDLGKGGIVLFKDDEVAQCNFENVLIISSLKTLNILFSACVMYNTKQVKSKKKVIKIGGLYTQSTVPDPRDITFSWCVLRNCTIPFENIYMIDCVIENE